MQQKAIVIGGGLAGMTVAKELLKGGMQVDLVESLDRLGGKAGADYCEDHQLYAEHGYHVFPAWYGNTRQIMRDLGTEDVLFDIDRAHSLVKGRFPEFHTVHEVSGVRNVLRNVFSKVMPWPDMFLGFYFVLDLASERFRRQGFLDRVSVNGLLRSRFYASEEIARAHQREILQAQSVPFYEISAMTMQTLIRYWSRYPSPLYSVLSRNLHEGLIGPFEQQLRDLGCTIHCGKSVAKLLTTHDRVSGLDFEDGSRLDATGANDIFVIATPPNVTSRFVDDGLITAEQMSASTETWSFANLSYLKTAPMAGLTLCLNRRVAHLPKEPVTLIDSPHYMACVDISQQWDDLQTAPHRTVLSLIVSNFEPLKGLSHHKKLQVLIDELGEYIPVDHKDIEFAYLQENLHAPLFLNTVGSWRHRPCTRTRLANLYITGDYCRTRVDLTTMEGVVTSGLETAKSILHDHKGSATAKMVTIHPHKARPRVYFFVDEVRALTYRPALSRGQSVATSPLKPLRSHHEATCGDHWRRAGWDDGGKGTRQTRYRRGPPGSRQSPWRQSRGRFQ
ncbi:MAG: hypothetical protein ETSY1_40700 [Candidatus Entotheonella factor]|uniref:Amine oxidase domain-containing protein n=1 Tax=Entotheonella factor TaxID=1429438 RepID=W4L4R8_ENTF1|nr:MAG: hypothetical protein ETSY1_40700 [Candidatus Entotheonella factor]